MDGRVDDRSPPSVSVAPATVEIVVDPIVLEAVLVAESAIVETACSVAPAVVCADSTVCSTASTLAPEDLETESAAVATAEPAVAVAPSIVRVTLWVAPLTGEEAEDATLCLTASVALETVGEAPETGLGALGAASLAEGAEVAGAAAAEIVEAASDAAEGTARAALAGELGTATPARHAAKAAPAVKKRRWIALTTIGRLCVDIPIGGGHASPARKPRK